MTTTTRETVDEWAALVNSGNALREAGLNSCEVLHTIFPGIVGDHDTMDALAAMLEPVFGMVAALEMSGAVPPGGGAEVAHDLFHLLQIAAGLGHMLGVADALAMADDLGQIDDLDDPDTFGILFALPSPHDEDGTAAEES